MRQGILRQGGAGGQRKGQPTCQHGRPSSFPVHSFTSFRRSIDSYSIPLLPRIINVPEAISKESPAKQAGQREKGTEHRQSATSFGWGGAKHGGWQAIRIGPKSAESPSGYPGIRRAGHVPGGNDKGAECRRFLLPAPPPTLTGIPGISKRRRGCLLPLRRRSSEGLKTGGQIWYNNRYSVLGQRIALKPVDMLERRATAFPSGVPP